MSAKKVLFISQEITPYVPETSLSKQGRILPQTMQENGWEIRTFLPKWGNINERRNQLHEVIRLSGMNIIIDDTDHPLIIKVASILPAHMQVYFIDNEDFFQKRGMAFDANGAEYADNAERAIFYARGVLETVKKLRWCPDVIQCQGWMSAIVPFYVRTAYQDDPPFRDAKLVMSLGTDELKQPLPENFARALAFRLATPELIAEQHLNFKEPSDMLKLALNFSDAVTQATPNVNPEILDYAREKGLPILDYQEPENYSSAYNEFFSSLLPEE